MLGGLGFWGGLLGPDLLGSSGANLGQRGNRQFCSEVAVAVAEGHIMHAGPGPRGGHRKGDPGAAMAPQQAASPAPCLHSTQPVTSPDLLVITRKPARPVCGSSSACPPLERALALNSEQRMDP